MSGVFAILYQRDITETSVIMIIGGVTRLIVINSHYGNAEE